MGGLASRAASESWVQSELQFGPARLAGGKPSSSPTTTAPYYKPLLFKRLASLPAMDNSPTSLFESYEQDFQSIIGSIKQKVEVEAVAQTGGANGTKQNLRVEGKLIPGLLLLLQSRGKRH